MWHELRWPPCDQSAASLPPPSRCDQSAAPRVISRPPPCRSFPLCPSNGCCCCPLAFRWGVNFYSRPVLNWHMATTCFPVSGEASEQGWRPGRMEASGRVEAWTETGKPGRVKLSPLLPAGVPLALLV